MVVESTEELNLEKFKNPNKPLAGKAGLQDALDKGLIRKAEKVDVKDYLDARNKVGGLTEKGATEYRQRESKSSCSRRADTTGVITDTRGMDHNAYVVLSPDFVIPAGLSFPKFYVPKGLPAPQERGHSCSYVFVYDELRSMAE